MKVQTKKICAVIPVFNRVAETLRCLSRLASESPEGFDMKIVLVDDGSTDGTAEKVGHAFPDVTILEGSGDLWWAGGVNAGLRHISKNVDCDYILILNNDTVIWPHTLTHLMQYAQPEEKVVLSPLTVDAESGRIYSAGEARTGVCRELRPQHRGKYPEQVDSKIIECDAIGTRLAILPKRIIADVGYFDGRRFPHGYSDFDYFLRAKAAGYRILVIKNAIVSTEQNRNYMNYRLVESSLAEYLESFLDKKYDTYLKTLFHKSFAHKHVLLGSIAFGKLLFSHLKWILFKILLPRSVLTELISRKWLISAPGRN
jgi:GT2 family glycosyltransferase